MRPVVTGQPRAHGLLFPFITDHSGWLDGSFKHMDASRGPVQALWQLGASGADLEGVTSQLLLLRILKNGSWSSGQWSSEHVFLAQEVGELALGAIMHTEKSLKTLVTVTLSSSQQ